MILSEIVEARKKILANAEGLVNEAEILFTHQKYPRAFALAHLACEELAKLPMLNTASLNLLIGENNDWHKIGRRLVSHSEKLQLTAHMDYMWDEVHLDDSDVRKYEKSLAAIPKLNNLKNASLYAGIFYGAFMQPSEVIDKNIAQNMLQLTDFRLSRYREYEQRFYRLLVTENGKKHLADSWRLNREIQQAIDQHHKDQDLTSQ